MKTETAFRVGLQKVHLLLQFAAIGKIVVTVAESDIFGAATAEQGAHIGSLAISVRQQHRPDTRVFVRVVRNNLPCAISGTMIHNNMLHGKVRPLSQNAFNGLAYICSLIIG